MSKELEALKTIGDLDYIDEYDCRDGNLKRHFNEEFTTIEQALLKVQEQEKEKYYKVMIRQYSIMYRDNLCYVKFIKTKDLYHWIGKYYSTALEKVERLDYQEIDEETFNKEKPRTYYKGELLNESL